jgi:hypothetical protein
MKIIPEARRAHLSVPDEDYSRKTRRAHLSEPDED